MKLPTLFVTVAASAGTAAGQPLSIQANFEIHAIQAEKAARTPAQQKIQSSLLYLMREAKGLAAVEGAPGLKSGVPTTDDGQVLVDISAPPSQELADAITAANGVVIYESIRWKSVRATLPPAALTAIAARPEVKRIAKGARPTAHAVTNEADAAHKADIARLDFGVNGTGIKVGVISDSADHYTASVASGELPPSFTILPGRSGIPGTGEGTAMSEIVHDIAPGAQIYFASASGGKAFFADSILQLRAAGCRVIVDDISYGSEWQFQDDEIGQAVREVVADGAVYLSSSGNEGSLKRGNSTTWEGNFVSGGSHALLPVGTVHNFGAQNYNRLPTGTSGGSLQWSDEYNTSANDYDLFVLNAAGTAIVSSSTDTQDGDDAPFEFVEDVQAGERIVIWKANSAADRYIRISFTGSPLEIQTAGQTIGHAATPACICVAASDASEAVAADPFTFTTASPTEDSSSDGPHKMFYHPDGTPITPGNFLATGGVTVQTPSITAGDGGATSVPGFEQFYGTSAAAPAAAAMAALVLSRDPSLTDTQVRTALETSTLDIEGPGQEVNSGHGLVMAELLLEKTLKPQENWRKLNFNTYLETALSAPSADPDKDGLTNLLEYALGTLPHANTPSPFSVAPASPSTFALAYQRNTAATDVTLVLEHSTNLGATPWAPLAPSSDVPVSTTGNVQTRLAVIPKDPGGKDFYRAKVTPVP